VRQRSGIISSRDSLIAQGVDRIENRGPVRGIEAEEQADHAAHGEGEQYRVDVHDGVEIREYRYQPCQADAEEHADESAEKTQRDGFRQELELDGERLGSDRHSQADFARAFGHTDQHDVHVADPAERSITMPTGDGMVISWRAKKKRVRIASSRPARRPRLFEPRAASRVRAALRIRSGWRRPPGRPAWPLRLGAATPACASAAVRPDSVRSRDDRTRKLAPTRRPKPSTVRPYSDGLFPICDAIAGTTVRIQALGDATSLRANTVTRSALVGIESEATRDRVSSNGLSCVAATDDSNWLKRATRASARLAAVPAGYRPRASRRTERTTSSAAAVAAQGAVKENA